MSSPNYYASESLPPNLPQLPYEKQANYGNIGTMINKQIPRANLLAKKFNIKINKGKRDAFWEFKRKAKLQKVEQMLQNEMSEQERQQYGNRPINSPNDYYMRKTPYNNDMRNINNNVDYNNNEYRQTPHNNEYRPTPYNNEHRQTPHNNGYRQSPYNNSTNFRQTPYKDKQSPYDGVRQTPYNYKDNYTQPPNNTYRQTPPIKEYRPTPQSTNNGNNYRQTPINNYPQQTDNNYYKQTPNNNGNFIENNRSYNRQTPYTQNQNNGLDVGSPLPAGAEMGYRRTPNQYTENNYNERNEEYGNQPQNSAINYNNGLKGSRTPFVGFKPSNSFYNQNGFNNRMYNNENLNGNVTGSLKRPMSRPFGEISFKQNGANNNQYFNGQKYASQNYSNPQNYY